MAKMGVGQQLLELQVKEKCGNQVVKVILDRIRVSGSVHNPNKYYQTCSSPKTSLENQDSSFQNNGRPSRNSAPNLDRSRPQRKITKSYIQYFDKGNNSGDDVDMESDPSGSDSEQKYTSHSELRSSPLNKAKRKTKSSKKKYSNLDPGDTAKEVEIGKTEPKIACSVCNKNILARHMKQHFQRKHPHKKLPTLKYKEAQIPCVFCPASVTHRHRWGHLQKKHPEQLVTGDLGQPRKVKCDLCPSVLLLEELYVHKKAQHPHNIKVKANTSFQCDLCSLKYKSIILLENHILKFHVVDKPFECDICFRSYLTEELLQKHIKVTHKAKNFSCGSCPTKFFSDSASLKKHMEKVHRSYSDHCESESTDNKHLCPVCNTYFSTESDLVNHLQQPRIKSVMKCKLCSEPVYTPCRLIVHLKKMHSATPKAETSIKREKLEVIAESTSAMEQSYLRKKTKTSALVKNQVSPNKFSCVVCSAFFSRRCDLDLHELHENHRRWKCPICTKLVVTKIDLKTHIESVHSDARPFHCTHQGCCKSFKVRPDLKKHMVKHDPDGVRCTECFRYFTKRAFALHVANKHRVDQAFKCDVCSKTWGTLKRLKQHLFMHTDERPFPCKFCDVKYKCAREANRHTKKCQVRSEDQRKKYAKRSRMVVQQAKTRKPRIYISGRRRKLTEQTAKLKETSQATPIISTSELTSPNTSLNGNGTDLELVKQETVKATPIFTSESICGTTDLNKNETHSALIKQKVDLKYVSDNSSVFLDQPAPGPELCAVKLEIIPKQEMWTYSD